MSRKPWRKKTPLKLSRRSLIPKLSLLNTLRSAAVLARVIGQLGSHRGFVTSRSGGSARYPNAAFAESITEDFGGGIVAVIDPRVSKPNRSGLEIDVKRAKNLIHSASAILGWSVH